MTTLELKLNLPDGLADEAQRAGLLTPEAIESMLREAVRRGALKGLKEAMDRMAAVPGSAMTPDEIQEEIRAARVERRVSEGRAAGS